MNTLSPILTEEELEAEFEKPDNSEPRRLLREGHPIVYRKPDTPAGHVIRRYPDGRRELVRYENREVVVVAKLPPVAPELEPAKYDPDDLLNSDDE